jgi:hypothetical protein
MLELIFIKILNFYSFERMGEVDPGFSLGCSRIVGWIEVERSLREMIIWKFILLFFIISIRVDKTSCSPQRVVSRDMECHSTAGNRILLASRGCWARYLMFALGVEANSMREGPY